MYVIKIYILLLRGTLEQFYFQLTLHCHLCKTEMKKKSHKEILKLYTDVKFQQAIFPLAYFRVR